MALGETSGGSDFRIGQLFQPANLLSLSRILITPLVGYYLWKGDTTSTHICAGLLILAGITDGLDGYLARRMGQISNLGKMLDPLADKLMATSLIILLVLFREFPVWLALIIIGRDLLILAAGYILLKKHQLVVPSSLAGKYAFASIAALIGSYVYRFPFGIYLMTGLTVVLLVLTMFIYMRRFVVVIRRESLVEFVDRPIYYWARTIATTIIMIVYFVKLAIFLN